MFFRGLRVLGCFMFFLLVVVFCCCCFFFFFLGGGGGGGGGGGSEGSRGLRVKSELRTAFLGRDSG